MPEGGVLYVFLPTDGGAPEAPDFEAAQREWLSALWVASTDGKALPFDLTRVSRGGAYDVFSLKVHARIGTEFVVRPVQPHDAITITRREKPQAVSLELTPGKDDSFRDSLSEQQVRVLVPSLDAPAFRVSWAGGSAVVPGRDVVDVRGKRALLLGRVYCSGTTAWWTRPTAFTVTALLSDGREVTAAPIVLQPPPSYESVPIRVMH